MTIDEAEKAVAAAEADLKKVILETDKMREAPKERLREAQANLLAALVDAQPLRTGDIIERNSFKKIERARIIGFRHAYGMHLNIRYNPLKKDGTPSLHERESYGIEKWSKVES